MNDENNLVFETPIQKNKFSSPELKAIKSLPNSIPFQSGMFSLALLTSFCLTGEDGSDHAKNISTYLYHTSILFPPSLFA